jgi:hypothetical protein
MRPSDRADSVAPLLRGALLLAAAGSTQTWSAEPGSTAQELADVLGTTPSRVRVAARGLVSTGCLRVRRLPNSKRGAQVDYGQLYCLPPSGEQYGHARRPRLQPVALVVAEAPMPSGEFCVALEREGMLPVAVRSGEAAADLLKALAFEMVVVDFSLASPNLTGEDVVRLYHLARQATSGDFFVANADARAFELVRASDLTGRPALPYHPLAVRAARQAS